jgi:NAD(P)-dependent dehydrogenase (short-subunit alcohol dehydrogenase family)
MAALSDALRGVSRRFALITGASSGIGEALARNLAARGVHVILAARRMAELRRIAMEIRGSGGVATAVKLDVSKTDELAEKLTALDKKFGGIDLVIANAGVGVRTEAPPAPRSPQASLPFAHRRTSCAHASGILAFRRAHRGASCAAHGSGVRALMVVAGGRTGIANEFYGGDCDYNGASAGDVGAG